MFTVCLIDDDPFILDDIASQPMWGECGFEIVSRFTSPHEALRAIAAQPPDLVCVDLRMPELDGLSLMTQLRAQGAPCEFVMLSAHDSFHDSRRFFLQDGFDYLLKPIEPMELQITLERLARRLFQRRSEQDAPMPAQAKSAVDEILAYIRHNYTKKLSLQKLSELFHLSPNYICNLLAKHCHQTFTSIVTTLRMREASRLIRTSGKPLKEIASLCGYTSYFYFCRVFKEFFGCTPGDFAAQNRTA